MDEDVEFQTVNFNLNENKIRSDQKMKIVQNVEAAKEIVKTGKNVIVAPTSPLEGLTIAFIEHDGAPVEFLEFSEG